MTEQIHSSEKPFGTIHVVLLCLSFGLLAAALAGLAISNSHKKSSALTEEQAFIDSLHVFPPIEFADSLYYPAVVDKYDDETPKVVVYYELDSLGNPTSEIAHETHYYDNSQKYVDGNRHDKERDGLWYAYYPDGTVQTMGIYENGKEQGRYTVYYPNGNVRYTGVYDHGRKIGEWRFYNEDGTYSRSETF